MNEPIDDFVQRMKGTLQIPSDCPVDKIKVPYGYGGSDEYGRPTFGAITFEKEYIGDLCIGWKLIDDEN